MLAALLGALSDPMMMQRLAQRAIRDMQVDSQEQGIEVANQRADQAARERADALAESIAKAEEAKGWGVFAQVAVRVAAVISAAVLTVAGAFTGGAGVALAAGLIILAFGADLGLALEKAGVDSDVTNAIGIGASIVGTACTFGGTTAASIAGATAQGAAVVAKTAAERAVEVALRILEATVRASAGVSTMVGGAYSHGSAQALADSEEADLDVGMSLDEADDMVADAVAFMESYQRVVERLSRAAEAKNEMRQASVRRFA